MLKVGLIGNGMIAASHRDAYKRIAQSTGAVSLEVICDVRPERLEGFEECRVYTDVDEMLEKEKGKLDYVDICVPTYLHAEVAIKAMEAGFHVLSEKPMARTAEQAQRMIEVAKETGKTLMIAYCNRFYEASRITRDIILSGELGRVRSADFYRENDSTLPMGWNDWYHDVKLSGGALMDLHIHDVDMIRWMFGMPKAVSVAAGSYVTKDGYDNMSVNYFYENGMYVHSSCSWIIDHNRHNTRMFRVNFEKGYVFVDRSAGRAEFVVVKNDGTVTDLIEKLPFDAYYNEIVYFADCIANGKPVEDCMPEECIDSVKIVLAEMKSADCGGERVTI